MAEQDLRSSTDSPSNTESVQNASPASLPTDYHELHALLRRSLSTKLNLPAVPSNSSSSSSLTFYCIETGSVAQSIRRRQSLSTGTNVIPQTTTTTTAAAVPLAEGRPPANEDDDSKAEEEEEQQQQPLPLLALTDVDRSYPSLTHSDNDSFNHVDGHDNDDDETMVDYSLHTESFPIPANYVSSPCPICFEQAVLQVSPCCYFLCCNQCWRAHISTTINDGRIKIPCVASDCAKYLTRESIVNFVRYDSPLHERYLKLYLIANQNPRAKTCPRCCHLYSLDVPTPASKEILSKAKKKINNKKIPKQVQCSECSLVWCFRCSAPWHENLTCKQFIKGDKLLLKWINQKNEEQWNARKCPKCSSLIQRAGGCPHMTCQSCSCEFCYLCGRRYVPIPFIGQHSNKLSMFGCPYNFYPEKPWLRRTIRGMIATGVVVASPVIVAGAVTAAVTVLPPLGIYKLVKVLRARRQSHMAMARFPIGEPFLIEPDLNDPHILPHATFPFDLHREFEAEEIMLVLRQRMAGLTLSPPIDEVNEEQPPQPAPQEQILTTDDQPDRISTDLGLENLFTDDSEKSASVFRTCPTTPACHIRKGCSRSLNNLFDPSRHQRILTRQQSMMIKY